MAADHDFPVDLTAIMLFASAIGETNPIYYDEEYAKGTPVGHVIAPPTFPISSAHWNPRYSLRGIRRIPAIPEDAKPAAEKAGGKGKAGGGALARGLHGEQRFRWAKPMEPGMRLSVSTRRGKTWSKEGKRGGRMDFSESITEYRDQGGELVCTATSVGIVTSKAVQSGDGEGPR